VAFLLLLFNHRAQRWQIKSQQFIHSGQHPFSCGVCKNIPGEI
jgi:hypothetical protein